MSKEDELFYTVEDLPMNNETKVEVLSKATYTAKAAYDCILCHKPIAIGSHYVRIVVKPVAQKVQTQRWCLPCWLG